MTCDIQGHEAVGGVSRLMFKLPAITPSNPIAANKKGVPNGHAV
ncbi:MAG: hypothetical protein WCC85_20535 [Candidatus Sulfotelmatobacter sp.]